jgi:transposase InsO family protein
VLTDNGSDYSSHFPQTICLSLGAKPIKFRLYTPRTTGKAERFSQTSPKEWAYKQAYEFSAEWERLLFCPGFMTTTTAGRMFP